MPCCNELFYRQYKNNSEAENSVPLVLLHGSGGSHLAWPVEIRRMRGCNVIALDLPGHGQSGGSACQSLEALVSALHTFFRECAIRKMALIGYSLGAALAAAYARAYPTQVQGMALLAGGSRFSFPAALLDALRNFNHQTQFIEIFNRLVFNPAYPQAERRKILEPLAKIDPGVLWMDLQICLNYSLPADWEKVNCPVILINGADDAVVSTCAAREMAYSLPHASLTVLPGCGHMLIYEKTALITPILRDFFNSQMIGK
jgi:pimeloyl-ACP methyl ester carboxylesterase